MTMYMRWEFFPVTFYTTKFSYRRKDNHWVKNHLVPIIEKDLLNKDSINPNWNCNVNTNFHFDNNLMNAYKHFYSEKIEEFIGVMNINRKMLPNWKIEHIWYNSYDNQTYQEKHDHYPNHFSMIHYLKFDPRKHFSTKFFNPCLPSLNFTQQQMKDRMNQEFFEFEDVQEGDILFFPSFVPHLVRPNVSDETRITIALNFNLM